MGTPYVVNQPSLSTPRVSFLTMLWVRLGIAAGLGVVLYALTLLATPGAQPFEVVGLAAAGLVVASYSARRAWLALADDLDDEDACGGSCGTPQRRS